LAEKPEDSLMAATQSADSTMRMISSDSLLSTGDASGKPEDICPLQFRLPLSAEQD
jgi:hypothetical protein